MEYCVLGSLKDVMCITGRALPEHLIASFCKCLWGEEGGEERDGRRGGREKRGQRCEIFADSYYCAFIQVLMLYVLWIIYIRTRKFTEMSSVVRYIIFFVPLPFFFHLRALQFFSLRRKHFAECQRRSKAWYVRTAVSFICCLSCYS